MNKTYENAMSEKHPLLGNKMVNVSQSGVTVGVRVWDGYSSESDDGENETFWRATDV